MSVCFDGVGQVCATFLGSDLSEGQVVKLTASGTVGKCSAGDAFCGVALCCKDDACTVQVGGFVKAGYSGAAPSVGRAALCANGEGGVKLGSDPGGTSCLVVDVDTTAKTVTIML